MARSGGRSEWERQQAALRRELERQAREEARLAKEREKERLQQHQEAQQRAAEARTAAVEHQIKTLDEMLTGVLHLQPVSFTQLKVTPQVPRFDPGALGFAGAAPDWGEYAPPEPGAVSRMFAGAGRYERRMAEAREQFEAAMASYRQREAQRRGALAAARAEHERKAADIRAKAVAHNAAVDARQAAFDAGEPEAVEWFVGQVLVRSRYPDGFPHRYQVAYRPENRDVVVEFELPPQKVVPAVPLHQGQGCD